MNTALVFGSTTEKTSTMPEAAIVENKHHKDLWRQILAELQLYSSPAVYGTVLSSAHLETISEDEILLSCSNAFLKKNLERHVNEIKKHADSISKQNYRVTISIKNQAKKVDIQKVQQTRGIEPLFKEPKDPTEVLREKQKKANLSPKFTFDNYIVGKNNQLAFAIAKAVADKPGEAYNPAFIYSGVGLGKTHLLQAIGNEILKAKPGTKVIYTTGEAFGNELIEAIQSGKGRGKYASNEFRNKFRNADVFLIDDIQFVIGRGTTQEEFFHTFNTLQMAQKQIVITSDRPPKDFTQLEARITSRFSSGIIADIQQPDTETRIAILRTKRDLTHDPVPNNVIDFIAEKIDTNVRELEGAYLQVLTKTTTSGMEATLELAAEALGQTFRQKAEKPVNVNQILNAVCTYYSVKSADIKGERRTKDLVIPRQVAMYLIKQLTNTSYITIGEFLGGRDHSTIIHGCDKIKGEEEVTASKTKQDVVNLRKMIFAD